jgi:hypothetical protein
MPNSRSSRSTSSCRRCRSLPRVPVSAVPPSERVPEDLRRPRPGIAAVVDASVMRITASGATHRRRGDLGERGGERVDRRAKWGRSARVGPARSGLRTSGADRTKPASDTCLRAWSSRSSPPCSQHSLPIASCRPSTPATPFGSAWARRSSARSRSSPGRRSGCRSSSCSATGRERRTRSSPRSRRSASTSSSGCSTVPTLRSASSHSTGTPARPPSLPGCAVRHVEGWSRRRRDRG